MQRDRPDFSRYISADNTAAPGILLFQNPGNSIRISDISVWNQDVAAATVTFYDELSAVYLILRLAADENAIISLNRPIVYGLRSVYVRTSQATNTEITITGWLS